MDTRPELLLQQRERAQRNADAKRRRFAAIRSDYEAGLSRRAIERKHNVGWHTVTAALASPNPPPRRKYPDRGRPGLAGHAAPIDAFLAVNPTASVRETWEHLLDHHRVAVTYESVRNYIVDRRGPTHPSRSLARPAAWLVTGPTESASAPAPIRVRTTTPNDHDTVVAIVSRSHPGTTVITPNTAYDTATLPALLAERAGAVAGLLTYTLTNEALRIITLDTLVPRTGIGSALLNAAANAARRTGAGRLQLTVTNDNLDTLRFWQRRGMRITAIYSDTAAARRLQPHTPKLGHYGIEIHDELTLEMTI